MENQKNKDKDGNKGYTPDHDKNDSMQNESREPAQNPKWDQAQRRQQAGPRSYNESLDSENISNQNTQAHKEQVSDEEGDKPNDPKKIGDQISERQQTIDEKDAPGERKKNRDAE